MNFCLLLHLMLRLEINPASAAHEHANRKRWHLGRTRPPLLSHRAPSSSLQELARAEGVHPTPQQRRQKADIKQVDKPKPC